MSHSARHPHDRPRDDGPAGMALCRDLRARSSRPRPRRRDNPDGRPETPVVARRGGRGSGRRPVVQRRWRGRCRLGGHDGPRRSHRRRQVVVARGRRGRARLRLGKQRERVDVALRLGRAPHPEVHGRARELRRPARAHGAHHVALGDGVAAPHRVGAEMNERDRVAVGGLNRDRLSLRRDGPGEGDRSRDRCDDFCAVGGSDVDTAVLSGRVRVARVEGEERQHRPGDGPAPAERGRRDDQRGNRSHCNE